MRVWLNSKNSLLFSVHILLCIVIGSSSVQAQLYETQGQAIIDNGQLEKARTKAMEDALKKALLVAGASVSSVQQVVNGLMTQDEISIRASGSVNAIELIDEIHTGDTLIVTIRADIFPQEKQCFSADFSKTLLLTRSDLTNREQANVGSIYNLDKSVVSRLNTKLRPSDYIKTKLFNRNKSNFARLNHSMDAESIKLLTNSLADQTDSHYVLYSEILDLSFEDEIKNTWKFWHSEHTYERNFSMVLYIYNGASGELVFENQYANRAQWTFAKRDEVDVDSKKFWQSQYGTMIDKTLGKMIKDIDDNIMCEPTRAKIVQVDANKVRFNLGKNHGVKIGDKFSLLHRSKFESDSGIAYLGFEVSSYQVKVVSTSLQSAVAETPDGNLLGNIQINDLAVRH